MSSSKHIVTSPLNGNVYGGDLIFYSGTFYNLEDSISEKDELGLQDGGDGLG